MIIRLKRNDDRKSITYTAELSASFEIMDEMNDIIPNDMIYSTLYRMFEDTLYKERDNKEYEFVIVAD